MEETVDTHFADDCFNHDSGGFIEVKFKLDSAGSFSLFDNYSD